MEKVKRLSLAIGILLTNFVIYAQHTAPSFDVPDGFVTCKQFSEDGGINGRNSNWNYYLNSEGEVQHDINIYTHESESDNQTNYCNTLDLENLRFLEGVRVNINNQAELLSEGGGYDEINIINCNFYNYEGFAITLRGNQKNILIEDNTFESNVITLNAAPVAVAATAEAGTVDVIGTLEIRNNTVGGASGLFFGQKLSSTRIQRNCVHMSTNPSIENAERISAYQAVKIDNAGGINNFLNNGNRDFSRETEILIENNHFDIVEGITAITLESEIKREIVDTVPRLDEFGNVEFDEDGDIITRFKFEPVRDENGYFILTGETRGAIIRGNWMNNRVGIIHGAPDTRIENNIFDFTGIPQASTVTDEASSILNGTKLLNNEYIYDLPRNNGFTIAYLTNHARNYEIRGNRSTSKLKAGNGSANIPVNLRGDIDLVNDIVTFTWDNFPLDKQIEYADNPDFINPTITPTIVSSLGSYDIAINPGQTIYARIRSINGSNNQPTKFGGSTIISHNGAPKNLRSSIVGGGDNYDGVRIEWDEVPEAIRYIVDRTSDDEMFTSFTTLVRTPDKNFFSIASAFGSDWHVRVRAVTLAADGITEIISPYSQVYSYHVPLNCDFTFQDLSSSRLDLFTNNELEISRFELSPNPVRDYLQINIPSNEENSISEIEIRNSIGLVVLKQVVTGNSNEVLDLSSLELGVFFVTMKNNEGTVLETQRIIKE